MPESHSQSGPSIKNIDLEQSRNSLGKIKTDGTPSYTIDELIQDDSKLSPNYSGLKKFSKQANLSNYFLQKNSFHKLEKPILRYRHEDICDKANKTHTNIKFEDLKVSKK